MGVFREGFLRATVSKVRFLGAKDIFQRQIQRENRIKRPTKKGTAEICGKKTLGSMRDGKGQIRWIKETAENKIVNRKHYEIEEISWITLC